MSSIYIQEPPTCGKVLLKTSVGDIDIELWAKETPKACRNFIQLCMEGYYDGTVFHRLIKGFIVQGGDPNGNGSGGESIYGEMFKDEFHSRLRYTRRGLVAMANAGKNDNGSQFFFTLGATPELQNKHTLFGKVTGDTLYNMLKLEDGLVGEDERPLYPHKILKTEILSNPFDDIIPRRTNETAVKIKSRDRKKEKGVKNFTLLSFGNEAEEDENETTEVTKKFQAKAKSSHDVLDDPKLSRETFKLDKSEVKPDDYIEEYEDKEDEETHDEKAKRIRDKLQSKTKRKHGDKPSEKDDGESDEDLGIDDYFDIEKEQKLKKQKKIEEIKKEISSLKKEYRQEEKLKNTRLEKVRQEEETKTKKTEQFKEYLDEKVKYQKLKEHPKKGTSREAFTLDLLKNFRNKLEKVKQDGPDTLNNDDDEDLNNDNWLSHKLEFSEQGAVLAKDAATKKDDWYDVYDPRNPLNQRRRGESSKTSQRDKK